MRPAFCAPLSWSAVRAIVPSAIFILIKTADSCGWSASNFILSHRRNANTHDNCGVVSYKRNHIAVKSFVSPALMTPRKMGMPATKSLHACGGKTSWARKTKCPRICACVCWLYNFIFIPTRDFTSTCYSRFQKNAKLAMKS